MKPFIFAMAIFAAVHFLLGCSLSNELRGKSMEVFDEVEYTYHRKGNVIHRELMATGDQKITPDDDLDLTGGL